MTTEAQTELDRLMMRLADGDRSVFGDVFRVLWPVVHRLCLGLLRDSADADDGAQQAMIKIMARASDYDPTRAALPWALAIATWECRTILRRRYRARELTGQEQSWWSGAGAEDRRSPEEDLDKQELVRAALHALTDLSASDQSALLASFWEEAGAPKDAAARKRRQRAMERLRAAFKRLYGVS